MNVFLAGLVLALGLFAAPGEEDRPHMEGEINDHPIRLTIDTGAEWLTIFSYAADRIGLAYHEVPLEVNPTQPKPGEIRVSISDPCRWRIGGAEGGWLPICKMPPGLRMDGYDGVMGWRNISNSVVRIDWGQKLFLYGQPGIPRRVLEWDRFDLYAPSRPSILALQVSESSDCQKVLYIDTGASGGVMVASPLWNEIVAQHPRLPMALGQCYTPAVGFFATTICWLKVLKVGRIEFHDVPVSEELKAFQQKPSYWGRIGLYGLTRLELAIDGPQKHAYVRAKRDYSTKYDYDRSGVAFVPLDNQSSDLVATVLETGPAYEAGIRNGDRLLRVNGKDVTGWRTDPNIMVTRAGDSSFTKPAGTKLTLTVMRDGHPMEVTFLLKELLPIEAAPASRPEDPASSSPLEKR